MLGWSSYISLECEERHVEAQAISESKGWMMSALRREIEVGGDTLSTKEYKDALSCLNGYQADLVRAAAELNHIRARIAELQTYRRATPSCTAAITQKAGSIRRRFSSLWRGWRH